MARHCAYIMYMWSCDSHVIHMLLPFQPTEYYDEQVAAEEQAGQVCMDDLMSEGLLLIRMEADSVGRYGFIFRVSKGLNSTMCTILVEIFEGGGWG